MVKDLCYSLSYLFVCFAFSAADLAPSTRNTKELWSLWVRYVQRLHHFCWLVGSEVVQIIERSVDVFILHPGFLEVSTLWNAASVWLLHLRDSGDLGPGLSSSLLPSSVRQRVLSYRHVGDVGKGHFISK